MEPENIDWSTIESTFVEDERYENLNAPKWIDLSAPDEPVDDEAWFCNHDCMHPKIAEDYLKSTRNSKMNLLRSVSISEILPFRDRSRRSAKLKRAEQNSSSVTEDANPQTTKFNTSIPAVGSVVDSENRNPNFAATPINKIPSKKTDIKLNTGKKTVVDDSNANSARHDRKPRLRSTFSARNLLGGRDILNQFTEFCAELKNFGRKGSRKGFSGTDSSGITGDVKGKVRERERMPLLEVKERGM